MNDQQLPLWELKEISKVFPGVQALDRVSFTLLKGEVHALLGENGSGKSTLAKCLAGVHQPDSGQMLLNGIPIVFNHPLAAKAQGVATIYQEFSLIPTLSVAENIFLGRPFLKAKTRLIDWDQMRKATIKTLERLTIQGDPDALVMNLSVAEQQLIEIAKAISQESTLLIMDEPSAALGLAETQRLLELIRRLVAEGKAILYISHRLDEVFKVADRVTVLKDGHLVGTYPSSDIQMNDVVRMMVGVDIEQHYPKEANTRSVHCLEVEDLSTDNGIHNVSFTINVGEVFGLGGMVGSGRTEIARALFGIDRRTSGTVRLYGREVNFHSPAEAIAAGVGLITENRKIDGLFFNFEGPQNITISRLVELLSGPFLDLRREKRYGRDYIEKLSITKSAIEKSVKFLSGGNQQKIVIARWLFSQARLLILDEPTQGIDIGAKLGVYKVINELTTQGISILLISLDYPELLAMSDRLAVVRDGKILHIAEASRLTEYQLMAIASGADPDQLVKRRLDLQGLVYPHLRALRDRLKETVHLAVLEKQQMQLVYLEKLGVGQNIEMISKSGATGPLTCTGLGKTLLAFLPPEEVEAWVKEHELPKYTEATITDPAAFMSELNRIRQSGFGLDQEEHEKGIRCIAAPIYDNQGNVVAAISVSGPSNRMPVDLAQSPLCREVVNAALTISHALGYSKSSPKDSTAER